MKRIIIDCDPGNGVRGSDVDDGIALALAFAARNEFAVEAVTVVSGNTSLDTGYNVARDFVSRFELDVPVVAGASRALLENPDPWVRHRQRDWVPSSVMSAWDAVTPPPEYARPLADDAAGAIIELVAQNPGEITLVAVGPLTNVAHAMQRRPEIASELAELVIMGGAFNVADMLQELNFAMDPEAAEVVMGSGANITLVPFDVTATTRLTVEDMTRWDANPNSLSRYLIDTVTPWIRFCEHYSHAAGCNLHDPLAIAYLLDPSLCEVEYINVGVELKGVYSRGRPIAWRDGRVRLAEGLNLPARRPIRVLTSAHNDRLVELIIDVVSRWREGRPS